jgi:hypothetical protein
VTKSILNRVLNWHAARSDDFNNPIVPDMLLTESRPRKRALSAEEIKRVWLACDQLVVRGETLSGSAHSSEDDRAGGSRRRLRHHVR